jgi:hypothetical protein
MIIKWRKRNERPPLYLSLVFAFFTAGIVTLAIGLAEAAITGYYKEIYRFSLPLAYSLVAIGNLFLWQ